MLLDSYLKVTVLRNGTYKEVGDNEIVVGDVIRLRAGMKLPVDGIVI